MNDREAFEAWADKELYALDMREDGFTYKYSFTRQAWLGWQAALASQAQQEPVSQWISVDERLPEMAQKVFGIYDAGMCAFMRVRSEDDTWCWAIGRNDLYDDFFYDADDNYQITHWMPLPPAPEGGQHD